MCSKKKIHKEIESRMSKISTGCDITYKVLYWVVILLGNENRSTRFAYAKSPLYKDFYYNGNWDWVKWVKIFQNHTS
jgi:hypothetical protein